VDDDLGREYLARMIYPLRPDRLKMENRDDEELRSGKK